MECWDLVFIFAVIIPGVRADEWDDFAGNFVADLVWILSSNSHQLTKLPRHL